MIPRILIICIVCIPIATAIGISWCHHTAAIEGRWGALGPGLITLSIYFLTGLIAWPLWVIAIGLRHRVVPILNAILFSCITVSSFYVSRMRAESLRQTEIAASIDAGLQSDCQELFARFRDDSQLNNDGYLRFWPGSKEFDTLPKSIRLFNPVYVTIEDQPLNIGLCKNGFGGFHMGLRVFHEDSDIIEWLEHVESTLIAPRIYLWIAET